MIKAFFLGLGLLLLLVPSSAHAAETDQFMTWGIELRDSADLFNNYLNEHLQEFLIQVNHRTYPVTDPQQLTELVYEYFFQGIHSSRVRNWLSQSPKVDRYPGPEVSFLEYQQKSILRGFSFPYVLPMAHTIRVGDVYFGIDKISHFFGFGRRYYQRYSRDCKQGFSETESMRKAVLWGLFNEESMVGKLVDGIFSHGDMEANFQGFMMARDLCAGEPPYVMRIDGEWRLVHPIDIQKYVTPDFDESYNTSHYWSLRERNVLPILKAEYCPKLHSPQVKARFERYRAWIPSFSQKTIAEYYDAKRHNPQREQSLEAVCPECQTSN